MTIRRLTALCLILAVLGGGMLLVPDDAEGDARTEMDAALKRGAVLWAQKWNPQGKTCKTCHDGGRNKLTAARLNQWPKYDKTLQKVVTGQQKINHMIRTHGKGEALALGSDDLNALEAYAKSR